MQYKLLKNKKGDVSSLIISLVIIVFVMIVISLFFSQFFLALIGEMKGMPQFPNQSISAMTSVEEKTIPFLDYLIFFSFISIIIGLIISSIFIDVHPAFFVVFIIVLIFAVLLAGIFSNVFNTIGEDTTMSTTYSQFQFTPLIVNHFPLMVFITGIIVSIILYGKSRGGNVPV
jgi:hypothetical protein